MRDHYNLGVDLTDRFVVEGNGDSPALLFEDSGGFEASFSFRDLSALSNRFANVLRRLGVGPGDRVFFRLPNHPAFYYGALGCSKVGAVFIPSSTLFKEQEIRYRLRDSQAVLVVTTADLLPEVEAAAADVPDLREVLVVDNDGEPRGVSDRVGLSALLEAADPHFRPLDTEAEAPAFIAYSSGTTGDPKGILHMQRYARSYDYLARDWHGYSMGDVCACPPEIGWMLPVASAFLFSMRAGVTTLLYREREPRFRPDRWLELIEKYRITSFIGTPTIYRMLLTVPDLDTRNLSSLIRGTSAGEPLPPDTFERVTEAMGFTPLDGIGMSECMVYVHNRVGKKPVAGSCGEAADGLELRVLDEDMQPVSNGEEGVLALRRDSHPGLMREYLNKPDDTAGVFRGDWYWTGDVVTRDDEGRFFFAGRDDDVMNCSGYRISPFEVESALQSHPSVLESAAVESPDPIKGQVVKGFCTLREGVKESEELTRELIAHVRSRLAPFKAPRKIEIVGELPKTQSGKIKRRILRDQEQSG